MSKTKRIPDISDERLLELYQRIRPIRKNGWGQRCWLNEFNLKDLRNANLAWSDKRITVPIDETGVKLRELGSFKCLHTWNAPALFHPTVAEVLAQIPKELVGEAKAFEIDVPAFMYNIHTDEFASKVFKEGYHVSTVVLYALD